MKINWNEKYQTVSVYSVITFTICLVIYFIIKNVSVLYNGIKTFVDVCSPIIWGIVIAYLINPIMVWSQGLISKITGKKKPRPKLDRILAVIVSMIIFLASITALIMIIIPQSIESIMSIINNYDTYIANFQNWINGIIKKYPQISDKISVDFTEIFTYIQSLANDYLPKVGDIIVKVKDGAVSVVSSVSDMLMGIFVAIYFLLDKEHFQAQCLKVINAVLPKKIIPGFMNVCSHTNSSLSGFISGKIIDSVIVGIVCFICMKIMKLDYATLISVIVGITNIIPIFGPIFGTIPGALLLLLSSPSEVIPFIILIIVIQQLDGNVLTPAILGDSTGLSAFWVLFSIIIGGGLFGFAGMIIGTPIFAVMYSLINELINYVLRRKGLSDKTADYFHVPEEHHTPAHKKSKMSKKYTELKNKLIQKIKEIKNKNNEASENETDDSPQSDGTDNDEAHDNNSSDTSENEN